MITLTVVIPHYNSYQSLTRLLDTIPERKDIQVIVVDDKSTNVDLCCYTYARNVRIIKNNTLNKGAGAARNIGLEFSDSQYVIFADSDDIFCDGAFDIIKNYTNKHRFDIVYFTPLSINVNGDVSKRADKYRGIINNYLIGHEESIRYKFHVPWSKLYRLDFLKENNIKFQEVIYSNDVMFSVKSGHIANKIIVSKESVYTVICGTNGLTSQRSLESLLIRFNVAREVNDYLLSISKGRYSIHIIIFILRMFKVNPIFSFKFCLKNLHVILRALPIFNRLI